MKSESSSRPDCVPAEAAAGTPVVVEVFAKADRNGIVKFSHEWRWGDNGPSQGNGKIIVPKRRSNDPETPMRFHLRDQSGRGFVFALKQGSAMWVKRDECPPEEPRCDDGQIPPAEMETGLKLLKAVNVNSEECTLHYRLWFKDRDGHWGTYDPEIINGGKNRE